MGRSVCFILMISIVPLVALGQTAPADSQTLQAILSEIRQLRHELQTGNSTAVRAQIALYRLERQDVVVSQAQQRLSDAKLRLANAESERGKKAIQIQSAKDAANQSQAPDAETHLEQVVLPELESELQMLQRQEGHARAEEREAEQQLREEQVKLDGLNNLLDRYNTALEEVGRK
jgi:valyl-tRNA synthetase